MAKIHATKLTLDDVMGRTCRPTRARTPIRPLPALTPTVTASAMMWSFHSKNTPDSAKTRAALLQYALELQMEVIQSLVNTETVTAVAEEGARAYCCVGRDNFTRGYEKIY